MNCKIAYLWAIAIALTACGPSERNNAPPKGGTSVAPTPMRYVEYPSQGVLLGQGWDAFRNAPASGICIEFAELTVPGHDIDIRVDDIYSRDQLNEALRLSVSASYSGVGAKASGRVDYSNSLSVDRTKSNVMATIEVLKGDQFVGPVATQMTGKPTTYATMRLNDAGRKALSGGADEFRRACGDSFVHHIKRGGRLNAYFSFDGLESQQKNSLAAAISASGWGGSVSAQMNTETEKKRWEKVTGIRVYQSGGPMQPTPMNGNEFNDTVRQFLATSDPDLFPTKAFEIGLSRYDNLPDWKSNESMGDPERLSELMVMYWLFNDLRIEYENIILNSATTTRLIDQTANWTGTEVALLQGDVICKYIQSENQWKLKSPASGEKPQEGCEEDKLAANPWLAPNVFLRAEQLKSAAITLRNMIQQCLKATTEEERRAWCERDRALVEFRKAYAGRLEKASAEKNKFEAWKKAANQDKKTMSLLALQSIPLQSAILPRAITPMFKAAQAPVKVSPNDKAEFADDEKYRLLVSLKADVLKQRLPDAVEQQGRVNMLDPFVIYLSKEPDAGDQDQLVLALARQYYIASMLVPPVVVRGDKEIKVGDAKVISSQTPGGTLVPDALKLRQALRNQLIPDHLRFSASQCARKLDSPLCKSINQIADLADELDFSPVLAETQVARTETRYERKCRWVGSTWKYPGGHSECENIPVTTTYQDLMTTFGSDRINF